jgi:RimJ/RimL family protein N-acetyltransferase
MERERNVILSNGTKGIVRPIIPSDADALAMALWELAPDSRIRRFFFDKTDLSEKELARFSSPDGINHIAYGLAVEIDGEDELKPVAVARCFRDAKDEKLAEIAVVTADAWQGLGAGSELLRSLSAAAYRVGIRRWFAPMLSDNCAMRRLLDRFATRMEERELGSGIVETEYEIPPPV